MYGEFNIAAARIDSPDTIMERTMAPQEPQVQPVVATADVEKRTIHGEPSVADRAEPVGYALQEPGGLIGDIMGAVKGLANDMDAGISSVLKAPAPAEGQQPGVPQPDTLAQQQAAILEANNTTWTHKAQFSGPGMA